LAYFIVAWASKFGTIRTCEIKCHEKGKAHIKHFERKKGGENNFIIRKLQKKKVKRPFIK